jgi:hypothetical protein
MDLGRLFNQDPLSKVKSSYQQAHLHFTEHSFKGSFPRMGVLPQDTESDS